MSEKARGPRLTIGYLAPAMHGGSLDQWLGVVDAAQEHDVNLICFPGWSPNYPLGFQVQASVLYDLVAPENVDGIITWASAIGNYMTVDEIQAFHERYRPLPTVSVGRTFEDIPGLLMDSYEGMCEAIVHLIEVHGCRRLAFIRGPQGHFYAQERYRAYVETLEAYDIPLDPNLVSPPSTWGMDVGEMVMRLLLDERGLNPGTDFEAVVAANDELIIGAWDILRARGVHIPGDVAVVGFDDRLDGRTRTPPLTSVAVPFYEVGYQSVETLLALMEGEQVPGETTVPSQLVVRQSCGCLAQMVMQVAVEQRPAASQAKVGLKELEAILTARRKEILAGMTQAVGELGGSLDLTSAEQLLDGFIAEFGGKSDGAFLTALDEVLRREVAVVSDVTENNVAAMQNAVSELRRSTLPYLSVEALPRVEILWQQARLVIGEAVRRGGMRLTQRAMQQTRTLREIGTSLITAFERKELTNTLAQALPTLGIPSAYLALYERQSGFDGKDQRSYVYPDPAPEWSRLILAYTEDGRAELEVDGLRFSSRRLVPKDLRPQGRRYSYIVSPLYFRDRQIGFAMFEIGPRDGDVYDVLRGEITGALQGALLLREREQAEEALERAYAEVEQQVRERTEELQREQEESARLQQEVIEAQKRAIQELSTPIIPVMERVIVVPLIGSIDTLRARDVTRRLLAGIREHRAEAVILDITGVPMVDSGVAAYLNKTIQAARLKGARTIVTGVSDAVAETIVDLGIDWSGIETLSDLRVGLRAALKGNEDGRNSGFKPQSRSRRSRYG
jgi:DNA-binding LacI/PurR family transcriptional regulator/anti-anti-sigma regulatory factor